MKRDMMPFFRIALAVVLLVCGASLARAQPDAGSALSGHRLDETHFAREQMTPADMGAAGKSGFKTVIDLRPDGEGPGQPSSDEMARAAREQGIVFHYVPVPVGPISDESVAQLGEILRTAPGPVLLYCRSGMRATRSWALAEASRPDGVDAATIAELARKAGFPVDDLAEAIRKRIAAR